MAASSSEETTFAELEKIAEGGPTGSSEVGQTEVKQGTTGKETVKAVPYTRFQEVISQKNEFQNKSIQYESKINEHEQTIANLTAMLKDTKESDDMIKEIRSLAHDPKHRPYVEYLHKVLMGEPVEEVVEEEDLSPQEVEDRRIQQLMNSQANLEDVIMDQRADAIINKADTIADKWLESLPEEYTNEDRNSIAHLWTTRVDWNGIEADPNSIESELARSFQDTLNLYGTPRGTLYTPEQVEQLQQTTTEEAKAPSPEEELAQLFNNKSYSSLKGSGKKNSAGAEIMTPEVSDEDFARDFAQAMKLVNKSRR